MRVFFLFVALMISFSAFAELKTPPLRVMPFSQLQFPPQLSKEELSWVIQRTADRLSGFAFQDLGDFSDFMHGHVVFRPLDGSERPERDLTDPSWTPDWSRLEAVGILFHTQEYDMVRGGEPYMGPNGSLSSEDRNWIYWLKDTEKGRRGELTPAKMLLEKAPLKPKFTVYSDDLVKSVFGANPGRWEYSVYFFKVRCDEVENALLPADLSRSNVTSVRWNGAKTCLLFQSFRCRNHPEDGPRCGGLEVAPDTRF